MYKLHEEYSCDFTGGPLVPKGFAIHHWGDPAQRPTFWAIVRLLVERARKKSASIHFVAEDSLVACLVSPTVVAWGQGDGASGWGNLNLVSIECNPRCSAGDRETVAELMADQHLLNGVPLVAHPHKKFNATLCPGLWEPWIPSLVERARAIVAERRGTAAPASSPAAAAPAVAPVAPAPSSGLSWIVDPGDTLGKIAGHYGIGIAELAAHNAIADPNRIEVGRTLRIPGPLYWNVERGDTLGEIAAHYGITAKVIADRNGIDPDRIAVGQTLRIA